MKSYSKHLTTTQSFGEISEVRRKPVLRSSAIFPVMVNDDLDSKVLFMGYWLIKRNIPEVSILVTLRSSLGEVLYRDLKVIDKVMSYEISVRKLLDEIIDLKSEFTGSLELEIFSTRDLVFPYPAFVLNMVSESSSTFVHTTGRIYNDLEDLNENDSVQVAESGFDILPNEEFNPYFAFVNGASATANAELKLELINARNETISKKMNLGALAPYETCWVIFLEKNEKDFFEGKKGSVKIYHDLKGFFPRFIAGNMDTGHQMVSLTHTYYDTSWQKDESAYWNNPDRSRFYDSSVHFPLFLKDGQYTELVLYPVNAPCDQEFGIEIFDAEGNMLGSKSNVTRLDQGQNELKYIRVNDIMKDMGLEPDVDKHYNAKIFLESKGRLPARLKFGLNVGMPADHDMPSNICFGARVPNHKLLQKPGTFKWAPILTNGNSYFIVDNGSFEREYDKPAKLHIQIWKQDSSESMDKQVTLNANGNYRFTLAENPDAKEFLEGKNGWITVRSDNPFVNAWYFEDMGKGVVGGDHSF